MHNIDKACLFFKALSDETRLKIVETLFERSMPVNERSQTVNMSQSAVSHQLKTLKLYNIVKSDRKRKEIYYSLNDDHVKTIISQVFSHTSHE